MKFAHLADLHLGAWREPELQQLNMAAFKQAIRICKEKKVEFVLIAGDLFDSSMPSIDTLKEAVSCLKDLKDSGICCYIIPGSHDYSASGKTFIDVFEKAGFCKNIANFEETSDGTVLEFYTSNQLLIAGLPGKKSGLEQKMFEKLVMKEDLGNHGDKIKVFMLHTTLTENKPKELVFVESLDSAKLPEGFDYYAAGHIHNTARIDQGGKVIVYPGPLFPNNFIELEELKEGNFFIIELDEKAEKAKRAKQLKIEPQKIKLKDILTVKADVDSLTPEKATSKIIELLSTHDIKDKILLLRLQGCIEGRLSSIDFNLIGEKTKGCYILLKNTHDLTSSELKIEVKTKSSSVEEIENEIIKSYKDQAASEQDRFSAYAENLISALDMEKQEGETNTTYESRLAEEAIKILNIKDKLT